MQLTLEQMKSLKRNSVSKNHEKSKARIKEDFSATDPMQKRAIVESSGQSLSAFYRLYRTGTPNARITLAMATELDVTPFYYTGEADEKEPCSDELILEFLKQHEYDDIISELKKPGKTKRAYNRKPKVSDVTIKDVSIEEAPIKEVPNEDSVLECPACDEGKFSEQVLADELRDSIADINKKITKSDAAAIKNLCEDEAAVLLKALFIRAKAGGGAAADLEHVKRLLLS